MNEIQEMELHEITEEQKQVFIIKDLSGLNWAFRKLNALHAELRDKNQLADAELERIETWRKKATEPLKNDVQYFEKLITDYHAFVLESDPKQKSISTPFGAVKSTTRKASVEKVDEQVLIEYARDNKRLDLVKVKEEIAWSELKKSLHVVEGDFGTLIVDENSQIVPGVALKPMTTTFKVEVAE